MTVFVFTLQPRRKCPFITMPPSDHSLPRTVFPSTNEYLHTMTEPNLTELPEVCRQTAKPGGTRGQAPHQWGKEQPDDMNLGNFPEKRRDTSHSVKLGSCRRIGLRRVGLGSSCDTSSGQDLLSQARTPPSQTKERFRPPTTPVFIAKSSSGDVSGA